MRNSLFQYYQSELDWLREEGRAFALEHPDEAGLLSLNSSADADPFVQRIVQSFAFLNAKTQKKLDDDFSNFSTALLDVLMPIWTRPIPAYGVVEFQKEIQMEGTQLLPRRKTALELKNQADARFQSCFDTHCSPIEISDCTFGRVGPDTTAKISPRANAVLEFQLYSETPAPISTAIRFEDTELGTRDSIRFHIEPSAYQYDLHELILNRKNVVSICVEHDGIGELLVPADRIRSVGFTEEQMILDTSPHFPLAYQLIFELLAFPQKHMFFDIALHELFECKVNPKNLKANAYRDAKISIFFQCEEKRIERLSGNISKTTFRLNCSPVVNLFEVGPIETKLEQYCVDQKISANQHDTDFEIFCLGGTSIGKVRPPVFYGVNQKTNQKDEIYSVFDLCSASPLTKSNDHAGSYHLTRREKSDGRGTNLYASLVNADMDPFIGMPFDRLQFYTTCCNRRFLDSRKLSSLGELKVKSKCLIDDAHFVGEGLVRMRTGQRDATSFWSLVSLLNANHLMFRGGDGLETFRRGIALFDFTESALLRDFFECLEAIEVSSTIGRMENRPWAPVASGSKFCITLNANFDTNPGRWYLVSQAVDQFVSLQSSINSFTQSEIRLAGTEDPLAVFEKRTGSTGLI